MSALLRSPRPASSTPAERRNFRAGARDAAQTPGVLLTIVWLVVIAALTAQLPYFLTSTNAITILNFSAVTFIAAAGFTIVLLGGGIDLAVGSTVMISGVTAGMVFLAGVPVLPAFVVGFLMGPLVGLVNGLLITRLRINPLIATLAMLFVLRGVGYLIAGSTIHQVRDEGFRVARAYVLGVPVAVYILAAVLVLSVVIVRWTKLGRHFAAIGGNPEAARQAAMNVERYRLMLYVVAGAYAGLAGILLASILGGADPTSDAGRTFAVATAVFLGGASLTGGKGSIVGTLIGVLFIVTLSNGMTQLKIAPEIVLVAQGILLIAAVAIDQRPRGGYR
jgi:ribose/xylose/arabinose/galactoside ABC-type transport system permease subunit